MPAARGERLTFFLPLLVALAGCAAPGGPRPPHAQTPDVVQDLEARQIGSAVVLQFTLPRQATDGSDLEGGAQVEIYRQFAAPGTPPASGGSSARQGPVGATPLYTLDASALTSHTIGDRVSFPDSFSATDLEAHRGEQAVYRVRTAAGGSGWSGESNAAPVILEAPPEPVRDLTAMETRDGILLRWSPPEAGASPGPAAYAVYRETLNPQEAVSAAPMQAGVTTESFYRDTNFQTGRTYRYTVRSVIHLPAGDVESADSPAAIVQVEEKFPPNAPTGVVAVAVQSTGGSLEVDVSWAISSEADLAGYNIYRSDRPGARGERLNQQAVPAAAFRDTTVVPGRSYWYSVTAVDAAGNESEPSAAVGASATPAALPPH